MGNNALATTDQKTGGIMDMTGGMSGEMAGRLNEMKMKLELVQQFFKGVMEKDLDYGIIPGTGNKPTLLKPGAEKLCELYGFAPVVKDKMETRDFHTGYYLAELTMQIIHRQSGSIIAEGVGEASSYESKYRFRWLFDSELPKNVDKAGLVQKTFKNKNGGEYTKYRVENIDLIDQWNTVLKMAKKRALVDAVLSATRTSGIFSQSEDEMDAWIEGETDSEPEKLQKQKSGPTAADERQTFAPAAGAGISIAQKNKIQYDAEKRGATSAQIDAIVKSTKGKGIDQLTKTEASAVIDWLDKVTKAEMTDLVIDVEMGGDK